MTIEVEATTERDLLTKSGRRKFLKGLGYGAAGAAAGGLAMAAATTPAAAVASLDIQILTFALNLEYLEASFYNIAATGQGLNGADRGGSPGVVTGGRKVNFTSPINAAYSVELATEETIHVQFLRAAIAATGSVPISMPNIDFSQSFATAAQAAGLGSGFDAFANDTNFLLASYIFEDVGVTAYHGALTSITNKLYLDKASGIMATEAYHAGIVRTALFVAGAASQTQAISFLRQQLTGAAGTPAQNNDHGVGTTASPTILDADGQAIAYDRTMRQVLNVVYGTPNASSGLFFPNGVNMAY